jgi:hypothetical protein
MVLCDITNVPKAGEQYVRKQSDVGECISFEVRAGCFKQHDEYLHTWVHGYDASGHWQGALAAAALTDVRRVRRVEEAQRKEAKEREKAEKARGRKAQRDENKAARTAAAKAAQQEPSAKPVAAKRKAPSAGAPTKRRYSLSAGGSAGSSQTGPGLADDSDSD